MLGKATSKGSADQASEDPEHPETPSSERLPHVYPHSFCRGGCSESNRWEMDSVPVSVLPLISCGISGSFYMALHSP